MKLRLLAMGCILVSLGVVTYFALGGATRTLILTAVGAVLLVGGIVYPNRPKQKTATQ